MRVLIFISFILSSAVSFACETPAQDRDLFKLFHVDNKATTWRSVKRNSFVKDKGFSITVFAKNSVEDSSVKLRRKSHTFAQVQFCLKGVNKVTLTHPKHGLLKVSRHERGEKSFVRLKRGLLSFTLRPIQYTLDKAPAQ